MKKIGFINGCFDILHVGHIRMFKFAKEQCDILIVGIDSDERVSKLKGESRPINSQKDRKEVLLSLNCIDNVEIFNTSDELRVLIKVIEPDIMVVGSDYRNKEVIGSENAKRLLFFERIEGYSTTKTAKNIGLG